MCYAGLSLTIHYLVVSCLLPVTNSSLYYGSCCFFVTKHTSLHTSMRQRSSEASDAHKVPFHCHLMLLLKQHMLVALASSLARNLLFEICSPVDILLIWKVLEHR